MDTGTAITENDRAAAIIESLDQAAIVLDETETVVHVNQAAAAILGIERDQILGRVFDRDLDDRCLDYAWMCAAFERAITLPAGEQQAELSLNVQGREHTYLLKPAPLRLTDGRLLGTLIILHDITELREKRRAQNSAVAAAAHELNTPLTSISLAVDLLRRNTEKQQELIDALVEDVERIRQVSAAFVSVAREQPSSIAVRGVHFDLGRLVTFVTKRFEAWIERKSIKFTAHTDRGLDAFGDPLKLSWVLATLVSNALRYTSERGTIELTAQKEDEQVRISVRDNGPGVPAQIRELVFRPSARRSTEVLEGPAVGLALAVAKEVAEAHGGSLFAEAAESGGMVTLKLPLSQDT